MSRAIAKVNHAPERVSRWVKFGVIGSPRASPFNVKRVVDSRRGQANPTNGRPVSSGTLVGGQRSKAN